jgi:hypothetical protein
MRGSVARTWRGALGAAIVILIAAAPSSARAGSFCETSVVHNYLKPLESLPSLKAEPARQRLPFGPSNLFFGISGQGPLIVDGPETGNQEVGYFLDYTPTNPHPTGKYLDWLVTAKLDRIDSTGLVRNSTGFKQVRGLHFRSSHTLSLELPEEPALYRLEVVFRDHSGKRLGRFGRYLRALKSHSEERLTLTQSTYSAGETVAPRLEDEGTDRLFYGLGYRIDEFDGVNWVPTSLGPKFFLLIGLSSFPGEAASCWRFTVPANTPPGRYRFYTSADVYKTTARDERPRRSALTAEFEVVP